MGLTRGVSFEDIQEGDRLPECSIKVEKDTYSAYNRLFNEVNPLHFDKEYALGLGFKDIVVAGVYTFSFIPKMIEGWVGDSGALCGIDITYHSPIYAGEPIVQKAQVREKVTEDDKRYVRCEVSVEDGEGNRLTTAMVTIAF